MTQDTKMFKHGKSLEEHRAIIRKEVPHIDRKPFSSNIIAITLKMIADDFGKDEANKAIRDFKLDKKGWSEE